MTNENECNDNYDYDTKHLISDDEENSGAGCAMDSNGLTSSIDDIVDNLKVGLFHYLMVLSCGLCFAGYNIYYQAIGFIIISACDLDIDASNKGWLSLSLMIGFTLGVGVLGRMADAYGRRKIFIFSVTINLMSMFASVFAYNYNMLVVMAAIIGCSHSGIAVTIHTYVIEFFPRRQRGVAAGSIVAFLILGSLFSSTVALITLPHPFYKRIGGINFSSWRLYLLIDIIPILIGYCILLFMPDSLRFALVKSEKKSIKLVLDKIDRINSFYKCSNDKDKQYQLLSIPDHVSLGDSKEHTNKNRFQNEIEHFRLFTKRPWLQ
ncbi:Synaptic vesicle glycoprotein 2B [Trichoplax sp. H2]|nr:Synaptic vesicle glycoprotein 2B [Trichoplax sp. H2]|eukprot:RDD36931.1 Synaptic vesicle glycoprotein 2B [Trichoplax sp. H2]